nr:uncharacterized protein LOC127321048 [Lolium perenne]
MLHQLSILGREMYRGYYTLDTCRCAAANDDQWQQPECEGAAAGPSSLEAMVTDLNGKPWYTKTMRPAIIGRARAGKSTLVEHACNDERVRAHFSQIVFFTQGDLEDGSLEETLRDGGAVRFSEPSDRIVSIGRTEPPLKLEFLTQEAYWYLFKVYAFGGTDLADHPKLASIAMDMSRECRGCFLAANIFPRLLRSNPCPQFGSSVLAALKGLKRNHYLYTAADHQEPALCNPKVTPSFMVLDDYEIPDSVDNSAAPGTIAREKLLGLASLERTIARAAFRIL